MLLWYLPECPLPPLFINSKPPTLWILSYRVGHVHPWVGPKPELWCRPHAGSRPSYLVPEGGGVGRSARELPAPPALSLHPPARLLRPGGVCALRAVFLTFQLRPKEAPTVLSSCMHAPISIRRKRCQLHPTCLSNLSLPCGLVERVRAPSPLSKSLLNGPSCARQTVHNRHSTSRVSRWVRERERNTRTHSKSDDLFISELWRAS